MHVRISSNTPVIVTRRIRHSLNREPVSVWGPLPAKQALADGHMGTSSGTVSVSVAVAPGHEYAGAAVSHRDGRWYVQTA